MSDADEPLPPGADEEEEAPPGTEHVEGANDASAPAASKPEDAAQQAAQPGAEYAGYYGQDPNYYGQQYAYPGYYGQGYPDAAAGFYPGWEGYAGQAGYPHDAAYAQPEQAYSGALPAANAEPQAAAEAAATAVSEGKAAPTSLPGPPPPPPQASAAANGSSAATVAAPVVQVLSLSAEEREAAEKKAAEAAASAAAAAAAAAAQSSPLPTSQIAPNVVQQEAAPSEVPREPAGLNEQLFAQMLQAQQAAAGGESSGAEPGSADKQGSAADSKKKVPVMLKGARLAFSRPGIISGRQPGPNRPSPGSQAGTESEAGGLEHAKSASMDPLQRPGSQNLDRTAFGQDGEDAPTPGRKPPTPKRERYLPSFSRSPLRPRQPSPTPAPEPPRLAPRELSPGSWQESPEPDRPKRHRRHRSSKDKTSDSKQKRRHRKERSSHAEPSFSPDTAPQEGFPERSHRRKHRSSKHRSRERYEEGPLRREPSGYDDFNRRPQSQGMGPPNRDRWNQDGYQGDGGPQRGGQAWNHGPAPPVHAPVPPSKPLTAVQISAQLAAAGRPPASAHASSILPQEPRTRSGAVEPAQQMQPVPGPIPAARPVPPPALESYSSEESDLDLADAEALVNGKGGIQLPSGSSSDEEDDIVGRLLKRPLSGPSAPPAPASAQAIPPAAPLPSAPTADEPMRARARQPRTYAAHLHEETGPPSIQPGPYERGPQVQARHWNEQQNPQQPDASARGDDRKERKSKKKHKKEKKRHRREHEKERRSRRGVSREMEPMNSGPPARRPQPPRGNDQYGRGRYFQHDDRQADPSGGAYSDGYEGPSFFKREERQQRQRRRYESGDDRSRSPPPRRSRRPRSDSRSPSEDGRSSKRRRSSRGRSPSRQPDVASAAIEAAKAAAAAAAQKAINEQQMQLTRPARRVYVGALPLGTSEVELIQVFTHVMGASGGINHALGAGPVVTSCYMNMEKRFAFVEFRSIEEATNALALDGVQFRGEQLKVRRPADYNPTAPGLLSQQAPAPILASAISAATQPTAAGHASLMPPSAISQAQSPAPATPSLGLGSPGPGMATFQSPGSFPQPPAHAASGTLASPPQQNGLGVAHSGGSSQLPGAASTPGDAPSAPGQALGSEAASPAKSLSNVLRLANMVTRQELADEEEYDDIVDDIREEIEDKYGTLRSVIVPKPAPGGPTQDPPGVGLVFVDFQDQNAARKAQSVLNGRMFADRTVQASFFAQAAFDAQQLS